jgi:DNA-binding Xre family transcriptional regulator
MGKKKNKTEENPHVGSSFDDFLEEEGVLQEVELVAVKRVIAFQIEEMLRTQCISKTAMAKRMHTSRASLARLLDPENLGVTLQTLGKAASVLGKRVSLSLH